MKLIPIVAAAVCAVALVAATSSARADGRHDGGGWQRPDRGGEGWHQRERGWRDGGWHRGEREDEGYRPVYGYAPPVYYAPPTYYAPPPPVTFGFSIR
jgi:hypothetical protein